MSLSSLGLLFQDLRSRKANFTDFRWIIKAIKPKHFYSVQTNTQTTTKPPILKNKAETLLQCTDEHTDHYKTTDPVKRKHFYSVQTNTQTTTKPSILKNKAETLLQCTVEHTDHYKTTDPKE